MSLLRASTSCASNLATSSSSSAIYSSPRAFAAFHTTASRWAETQRQRAARITRTSNLQKKAERERIRQEMKPHVVLGTRPGDETKWADCDLAKILVSQAELNGSVRIEVQNKPVDLPKYLSYGMEGTDAAGSKNDKVELFFKDLPSVSYQNSIPSQTAMRMARFGPGFVSKRELEALEKAEVKKARNFARVIDLRNANARGLAFENRRRIFAAFSPSGSLADSGYPEVQVALLTMKIRNIWDHLLQRKKDISGRRALRMLVHQRAKLLKYIKRVDRDRYDLILKRVALEAEAVEGELVV